MWSFLNNRLLEPVDVSVANLMAALGRYQGRQELYQHQVPQVLEALRQTAIVESTEASNRIEGIVIPPHRLRALMAQAVPQTRSESEIAGYRDVLARIHTGQLTLPITPNSLRTLHADLYAYLPGEGGHWKERDNVIRQQRPDGRDVVRFGPLPADETPTAMASLCEYLANSWTGEAVDKLLVILSVLIYAYREFEARVGEMTEAPGAKSAAVRTAVEALAPDRTFTIGDLERICPTVSRSTIRRALSELRDEGQVVCLGRGRAAQWQKL